MREIPEKMVAPPSSRGRLRIGTLFPAPRTNNAPSPLLSPCPGPCPNSALSRAEGSVPGVWRGSFGRVSARLTCKREAKRCRSDQRRHSLGVKLVVIVAIKSPPAWEERRRAFSRRGALALLRSVGEAIVRRVCRQGGKKSRVSR